VHLQRDPERLHALEHPVAALDARDSGIGKGRGARRIELDAADETALTGRVDLARGRLVGEIERHQRLEARRGRERADDAGAVRGGERDRGYRRLEIRHDGGPRETPGGVSDNGAQFRPVAQVQVPVVRPAHDQCFAHGAECTGSRSLSEEAPRAPSCRGA
jgi:hypothetical protein